jgi:hypothetical protein
MQNFKSYMNELNGTMKTGPDWDRKHNPQANTAIDRELSMAVTRGGDLTTARTAMGRRCDLLKKKKIRQVKNDLMHIQRAPGQTPASARLPRAPAHGPR